MKLIEIISQHRRDFQGRYQCQFCNHIEVDKSMSSYDDRNYHDNVIPNQKCKVCGKSTVSENDTIDYTETRYESWQQI